MFHYFTDLNHVNRPGLQKIHLLSGTYYLDLNDNKNPSNPSLESINRNNMMLRKESDAGKVNKLFNLLI